MQNQVVLPGAGMNERKKFNRDAGLRRHDRIKLIEAGNLRHLRNNLRYLREKFFCKYSRRCSLICTLITQKITSHLPGEGKETIQTIITRSVD